MKLKHFLTKAKHTVTDLKSAIDTVLHEAVLNFVKANLDDMKAKFAEKEDVKAWLDTVTEETVEIPAEVYDVIFVDLTKPEPKEEVAETEHMKKKCHEDEVDETEKTVEEAPEFIDTEVVVPETVADIITEQVAEDETKVIEVPVAGGETKEITVEAPAGDGVVAEVAIIPADEEAPVAQEAEAPKTEEEAPVNEEGEAVTEVTIENVTDEVASTEEVIDEALPVEEVTEEAPVEEVVEEEPSILDVEDEDVDLSGVFDETEHMDGDDVEDQTVVDSIIDELLPEEDQGEGNITEEAVQALTEADSIIEDLTQEEQEEFDEIVDLLSSDDEGQNPVEESPKEAPVATASKAKAKKASRHISMRASKSELSVLQSLFGDL